MYAFKYESGEVRMAPDTFDPDKPDFELLKDVSEVLCINRVLVKQMRLVVKPKEEIHEIRKRKNKEVRNGNKNN